MSSVQQNKEEGRYIYAVIGAEGREFDSKHLTGFTSPAIGGRGDEVHAISYQDIAAIISVSPVIKYPISRENTMAHQKVLEELMKDFTVLPVRFSTVASSKDGVCAAERIREEVLKARYEELKALLTKMNNKIELGLKAFWTDMKVIFQEIVDENSQIKKLRQKLALEPITQPFGGKATLGEMVKNALERKKAKEEKDILDVLKKTCVDWCSNKIVGDNMITNSAFLVEKSRMEEFDRLVDKLATTYNEKIKFKYVGPVPPINFVELVIVLEGGE
ncbi:MAG: GvpL/GvpF family gas vesicle protein [Thermodesulfovibrionales bacterium]|nr:GvpL/GvpF family gas vesicle protein [Thermodesulfovibrionales bacterium]